MLKNEDLRNAYAARYVLNSDLEKKLGVQIPFDAYLQDPLVAKNEPLFGFEKIDNIQWEPGLADGPTSARFAVVDYNGDTDTIVLPAIWDMEQSRFIKDDKTLDRNNSSSLQFHQVNVWVAVQRALSFYQEGFGMGRTIPWGFEGNRLIVVPHAGYCENAFYDRTSKSLQFYYFGPEDKRIYTCLSTDIINHEFAHAILDGIRPYFLESITVQTAAFHEFIGDFTAVLILLRNNEFRRRLADKTGGNLDKADELAAIAEQFGKEVKGMPYLRNAAVKTKMDEVISDDRPHYVSQVLTGAMYEILVNLSKQYIDDRDHTAREAYAYAIKRMQPTVLQPLDYLPPVDVTFKDYALAVLRHEALTNPKDPYGYYQKMLRVFRNRLVIDDEDVKELSKPDYLFKRKDLNVFYDIDYVARSRTAAYYFLNDNRKEFYIPDNQDFIVADLYETAKMMNDGRRLPREIVLEYIWQEDVKLDGPQFGRLNGEIAAMLCGGTLVFDETGTLVSWFWKPGTQLKKGKDFGKQNSLGMERRAQFLTNIEKKIREGQIGIQQESDRGLLGTRMSPVTMRKKDGVIHLELSPQLSLARDEKDEDISNDGGRRWQISF
jgi:hypothetical protein